MQSLSPNCYATSHIRGRLGEILIIINFNCMSEKNIGPEKQPNQFESYYHWLSTRLPEGLTGAENAIPVTIDGNEMELIIFEPSDESVSLGLFLPGHKYSRKTLIIDNQGQISEDTNGVLPDLDKVENEPQIISSDEQIVTAVMDTIKKRFPDN